MTTATELVRRFGGDPGDLDVEIGNRDGWGWADVVLAARLPEDLAGNNPYEYGAYDLIQEAYPETCADVERGVSGADDRLRSLLDQYTMAITGAD